MRIIEDDLSGEAIRALLAYHFEQMHVNSPPGMAYVLDIDGLKAPGVSFWSIWDGDDLLGCGALKELSGDHGEIKSMHTIEARRGTGIAGRVLDFILAEARRRGYGRLSLETGGSDAVKAARRLYASAGFTECEPIPGYGPDHHSFFMTLEL